MSGLVGVTTPLEDYALIGDGETSALVATTGSIDWLCLPRFDSPACCAALLGTREHGFWEIAPTAKVVSAAQHYQTDTLVLETELETADGRVRLTDFMPIRNTHPSIVRMVEGLAGRVGLRMTAGFRFDYGNMPPWIEVEGDTAIIHVGPDRIMLAGIKGADVAHGTVTVDFEIGEGERRDFLLTYSAAHEPRPNLPDADASLTATQSYWRDWIGRFDEDVPYATEVRRSLMTLKALIHRPTGGLVAAPTTSLPELPGGDMNWDYRFCWLRDATFTLRALAECGFTQEATAWRDWILRAVAGAPERMQIMYRVDGSRRLDEAELEWLPGYRFAKPVRIGNKAADQLQLDVYGELINMLDVSEKAGMKRTEQGRTLERAIIDHLERIWERPDHGIWEVRGLPRHYTASKVTAWAAFDRFLAGSSGAELSRRERQRLGALRDHIHEVICREAFNDGLGSFTTYFGGQTVDGSLLLLPKLGFLPVDDERMADTIATLERELVDDGLVRRYPADGSIQEGSFLACSFWLAECQLMQKRRDHAVRTIERAMAVASQTGLLSEEFDITGQRMSGNYPQALSHLALVTAVLALARYDVAEGNTAR